MVKIKTKKEHEKGIARIETSGEIKEIILKEDILNLEHSLIEVCFRGKNNKGHQSAGVIEFSQKEIEKINKEIENKKKMFKGVKVMKFDK